MNYRVKLTIAIYAIVLFSCSSNTNKPPVDSLAQANPEGVDSRRNYKFINDGTTHADLVFSHFVIKIHNFPTGGADDVTISNKLVYDKNKTKLLGLFAFVNSDTVVLKGYDFYHNIELIANNKTDKFKVSYFYKSFVNCLDDDHTRLLLTPDYKYLTDSAIYFFKLPKAVSDYDDINQVNYFKRKLKLKDTVAKNANGDEVSGFVSYKNKLCRIDADNHIVIKIERFDDNNKLFETKFLKVELEVLEEAESDY